MIKYRIDIMKELREHGFSSYELRKQKYLSESAMTKIRRGDIVGSDILDVICSLLDCQPGDILEYAPEDNIVDTGTARTTTCNR